MCIAFSFAVTWGGYEIIRKDMLERIDWWDAQKPILLALERRNKGKDEEKEEASPGSTTKKKKKMKGTA